MIVIILWLPELIVSKIVDVPLIYQDPGYGSARRCSELLIAELLIPPELRSGSDQRE